jgi:hypothetical protein
VFAITPEATVVEATVPLYQDVGVTVCVGEAAARVAAVPPPGVVLVRIVPKNPPLSPPAPQIPVPVGVNASERHTPPPEVIVVEAVDARVWAQATTFADADLLDIVNEAATACAGETAENPPIANADAATSAMRLMLVFVDIFFLSRKVTDGNFPPVAWPRSAFS